MTLKDLLNGLEGRQNSVDLSVEVTGLTNDSRRVEPGYLFFAFAGSNVDGRRYSLEALRRGAVAVMYEEPEPAEATGPRVAVPHLREAMARVAKVFHGAPDEKLFITAVTGTNGKTTTAYLIDAILRHAGTSTALLGTIGYHVLGKMRDAVNTTPDSVDLFPILEETLAGGGTHVVMEASSHALALGRLQGVRFHTGVFTNLTRDHLDFHIDMESYFAAKRLLFEKRSPQWAVINVDDEYGLRIKTTARVLGYGLAPSAALRAKNVEVSFEGLRFDAEFEDEMHEIESPLIGEMNVYNILAAIGAALSYGLDWRNIAGGVRECKGVPGRFERVDSGQPFLVVVDYAHTDDALRNTLGVARNLLRASERRGKLTCLFGCGGDRDRSKRPLMGQAAAEGADFVYLTSDNPRSENPLAIMNDALVGLRRFDTPHVVEPDRRKAIGLAIAGAGPGDIILLAGKGHETYQVLADRTIPFDDREVARQALAQIGYK